MLQRRAAVRTAQRVSFRGRGDAAVFELLNEADAAGIDPVEERPVLGAEDRLLVGADGLAALRDPVEERPVLGRSGLTPLKDPVGDRPVLGGDAPRTPPVKD